MLITTILFRLTSAWQPISIGTNIPNSLEKTDIKLSIIAISGQDFGCVLLVMKVSVEKKQTNIIMKTLQKPHI